MVCSVFHLLRKDAERAYFAHRPHPLLFFIILFPQPPPLLLFPPSPPLIPILLLFLPKPPFDLEEVQFLDVPLTPTPDPIPSPPPPLRFRLPIVPNLLFELLPEVLNLLPQDDELRPLLRDPIEKRREPEVRVLD